MPEVRRQLAVLVTCVLLACASCARPSATAEAPSGPPSGSPAVASSALASPVAASPAGPPSPGWSEDGVRPSPAPRTAAGGAPYRVVKMQHYWVFYQDIVYYYQRGQMQALVDNAPAIETSWQPCWPDARPRNLKTSSNVKMLEVRDHKGANSPLAVGIVIAPLKPMRAGEILTYDISYDAARIPYLHDEGGGEHRLLSLTINMGPDSPKNQYAYAIPANCTEVGSWDATPVKRVDRSGWKVFEYDSAGMPRITMHLKFAFGPRPTEAPPTAESIFSSLP